MTDKEQLEEVRGLATEDLQKQAGDARETLFKMRYQSMAEGVEHARAIRETRKRIARIKTVLREREILAAAKPEQGS